MIKKTLFLTLGWICVALTIIGAILPVMPSTPFAILAAYLFSKSSPELHQKMLNLKYIGPEIRLWEEESVIRPKAKVMSIVTIFATFGMSFIFMRLYPWVKIIMVIVGLSIIVFILTRKSAPTNIGNNEDNFSNTLN